MAEENGSSSSSGGLGKSLTGKVGGVPVWGIGVGLALVFIVVIWYRGKVRGAQASTDTVDTSTASDSGSGDASSGNPIDQYLASDPTNAAYPVGLTSQGTPAPITNTQWARLVEDELLAKGDDPTLVSNALTKYLSGQTLNAAESGIIALALQLFGTPPEGVLPINSTPTPTPTPTPGPVPGPPPHNPGPLPPPKKRKPKPKRSYTVKSGDTLSAIARKLGVSEPTLYAENKSEIDSTAKKHGATKNFEDYIYPEEVLHY